MIDSGSAQGLLDNRDTVQFKSSGEQWLGDFVDALNLPGKIFEAMSFTAIAISVGLAFLKIEKYERAKGKIEMWLVIFFTIEYLIRFALAPYARSYEKYQNQFYARFRFLISFFSIIDLLAIVPWYVALWNNELVHHMTIVRVLRCLRLLRGEGRYFEAFGLLDDVWREYKSLIVVTGFTGLVVWIIMSTLLWVTERKNENFRDEFKSIFDSMWWMLLNLTGEFPINSDLTTAGKILSCVTVILAVGVFGIPTGILGTGIVDIMSAKREEETKDKPKEEEIKEPEICNDCHVNTLKAIGIQGSIWCVVAGKNALGRWFENGITLLIVANVVAFSIQTIPGMDDDDPTTTGPFDIFEALSVGIFTVEYLLRLYACPVDPEFSNSRWAFIFSYYGLIDIMAILPFYIDLLIPKDVFIPTTFIRCLRLLRLLKADMFMGAFSLFDDVLRMQKSFLLSFGALGFIMWILFTILMFYTNRDSTDPEVEDSFSTLQSSSWLTLLNLTGEYPVGNYPTLGRIVSGFLALTAIGVFAIPTGIFADGFQQLVEEENEKEEARFANPANCHVCGVAIKARAKDLDTVAEELLAEQELASDDSTFSRIHRFLAGEGRAGDAFENFMLLLIICNITCYILSTDENLVSPGAQYFFDMLEWFTMVVFTIEYTVKFIVAPADPTLKNTNWPRMWHSIRFLSIVDFLSVAPFWVEKFCQAIGSEKVDYPPSSIFRIFRLLRLLKSEKYAPAFTILDDIFVAKRLILLCTGFVALILTIFFATILHYTERKNTTLVDELTMGQRYESMPSSLFFTCIHLSGDYPLYQYTTEGRITNFFIIVIAAGLCGIPNAILVDGFQSLLAKIAEEKKKLRKEVDGDDVRFRVSKDDSRCSMCRVKAASASGFRARVFSFLSGDTILGRMFQWLVVLAIVVGVVLTMLASMESISTEVQSAMNVIETASVIIFTLEYIMRIYAAPEDVDYDGRWDYATSFLAVVDLLAIIPFYVTLFVETDLRWVVAFRAMRMVRLLKVEHYLEAFTLFDNVFASCRIIMTTTILFAAIIWVVAATLFHLTEQYNEIERVKEAFSSVPLSMFYTILFLAGEWAIVDFTWQGKIVAVFIIICGVGFFAVPTGILFSGFEEIIAEHKAAKEKQQNKQCEDCGCAIQHFRHHRTADYGDSRVYSTI